MIKDTKRLSRPEIFKIVNQYIGVEAGYLGEFSYRTHHDFYLEYCGIENINPYDYEGTTRERFIQILSENPPHIQAKILEGVLKKYPLDSSQDSVLTDLLDNMAELALLHRIGGGWVFIHDYLLDYFANGHALPDDSSLLDDVKGYAINE